MKDLKTSTKQRFTGLEFDYPSESLETEVVLKETGIDKAMAENLVKIAVRARALKGHGLDEGISTRLLVYAAHLMNDGVVPSQACEMALITPLTDDEDIRATLKSAVELVMG